MNKITHLFYVFAILAHMFGLLTKLVPFFKSNLKYIMFINVLLQHPLQVSNLTGDHHIFRKILFQVQNYNKDYIPTTQV